MMHSLHVCICFYVLCIWSVFGFYPHSILQRQSATYLLLLVQRQQRRIRILPSLIQRNERLVDLESFDFSSQIGWDDFYTLNPQNTFEWHSSMPHSYIIDDIDIGSNVLLVGTGNSQLPRILYDQHDHSTQVICMDYSYPCMELLQKLHAQDCPRMKFVCGDVMHLTSLMNDHDILGTEHMNDSKYFDYVVDKGLTDALMCNEGFCFTLEKYLRQIANVLKKDGKLILISYKLIPSTREFLEMQGEELGMEWEFDVKNKSNDRVSYSVATLQH
jgi:SAM-dependent methyltransferase